MTLVMARQWGDRIIMLSDTMICDPNEPRSDIIPGQLKAIVLSRNLSVAYAGRKNRALDAIREVRKVLCQGADLHDVLEYLCQATNRSSGPVEFLVASHYEEPVLFKIWNGQISSGAGSYWIGDPSGVSAVQSTMNSQPIREVSERFLERVRISATEAGNPQSIPEISEWLPEEELRLTQAFIDVVRESSFSGVGGFSFYLLGSALGHCYQNHAGFFAWDSVRIGQIPIPEYRHFEKTGTTHYQFSLTSPPQRGAGVTGAFLPQIALGFIYSPLQSDQVFHRPGVTLEELSSEVNQIAAELICSSEFPA